jgi:hypothetical protein
VTGSLQAYDLDHPLAVDTCDRCSLEIWSCICNPRQPNRQPTLAEIEAARAQRLTRRELGKGAA